MPHRKAKRALSHTGFQVTAVMTLTLVMGFFTYSYMIEMGGTSVKEKLIVTNLMRLLIVWSLGWITLEFWRIQRVIDSPSLTKTFRKWFVVFLAFTVMRFIGAILDSAFAFMVGYFSVAATLAMHGYIIVALMQQRHVIAETKVDETTGKRRISTLMEEILQEMRDRQRMIEDAT